MEKWIEVAKSSGIPPGGRKTIKVFGASVTVFNIDGRFYAIDNTCPHQGGPLGEGVLEGEVVTCPWHAWKYNVRTGCAVLTPSVRTHEIRIIDGRLEMGVLSDQVTGGEGKAEEDPAHAILEHIHLGKTLDDVFERLHVNLQPIVPHNRLGLA